VLCPCHLPLTLALVGILFGGTAVGSVVLGNVGWVAAVLTIGYAAMLWRGFRHIRAAKRLAAQGIAVDCTAGACRVAEPSRSARR
jgi:hypothetical protein